MKRKQQRLLDVSLSYFRCILQSQKTKSHQLSQNYPSTFQPSTNLKKGRKMKKRPKYCYVTLCYASSNIIDTACKTSKLPRLSWLLSLPRQQLVILLNWSCSCKINSTKVCSPHLFHLDKSYPE